MEASVKVVILKLNQPITRFPELTSELLGLESMVRIPESVFIVRSRLTATELCAKLSALIGEPDGSVLVAGLSAPCELKGGDVSLGQIKAMVSPA